MLGDVGPALVSRHAHLLAASHHAAAAGAQLGHPPQPPVVLNGDAVLGGVLCLLLLIWWAHLQTANRCSDCGFAPIFCRCAQRHRGP